MGITNVKKQYIAKRVINFSGLKPPVRVDPGETIPTNVPNETIQDLLSDGTIEEVKETE